MSSYRQGHVAASDGLSIAYRDYAGPAERPPVLCLSGLTRNTQDYHVLAEGLAGRRRVVAMDYRGRGLSGWDKSGASYRPEVYVDDAKNLIAALGLGRCIAIGTSLGGFIAMGLAIMAPSALSGVVLNDAGPDPDLEALGGIFALIDSLVAQPPRDLAAGKAVLKTMLPDIGFRREADWDYFTAGTFAQRNGRLEVSWDPTLNVVLRRQSKLPPLWPLFGALRDLPVLLVRGERSRLLHASVAERMAALHPGMKMLTVPGAGHAPTLLEPESLDALDDFLARLDPAEPRAEAEPAAA